MVVIVPGCEEGGKEFSPLDVLEHGVDCEERLMGIPSVAATEDTGIAGDVRFDIWFITAESLGVLYGGGGMLGLDPAIISLGGTLTGNWPEELAKVLLLVVGVVVMGPLMGGPPPITIGLLGWHTDVGCET